MAKQTVTVKIQMLVEVTAGTWDSSVSYDSIKEASVREAKNFVSSLAAVHGNRRLSIIGEPSTLSVTMTADPREK